jgi:hypothetical protein
MLGVLGPRLLILVNPRPSCRQHHWRTPGHRSDARREFDMAGPEVIVCNPVRTAIGVATLCIGGRQGIALALEML